MKKNAKIAAAMKRRNKRINALYQRRARLYRQGVKQIELPYALVNIERRVKFDL